MENNHQAESQTGVFGLNFNKLQEVVSKLSIRDRTTHSALFENVLSSSECLSHFQSLCCRRNEEKVQKKLVEQLAQKVKDEDLEIDSKVEDIETMKELVCAQISVPPGAESGTVLMKLIDSKKKTVEIIQTFNEDLETMKNNRDETSQNLSKEEMRLIEIGREVAAAQQLYEESFQLFLILCKKQETLFHAKAYNDETARTALESCCFQATERRGALLAKSSVSNILPAEIQATQPVGNGSLTSGNGSLTLPESEEGSSLPAVNGSGNQLNVSDSVSDSGEAPVSAWNMESARNDGILGEPSHAPSCPLPTSVTDSSDLSNALEPVAAHQNSERGRVSKSKKATDDASGAENVQEPDGSSKPKKPRAQSRKRRF
ncbi:hypothetical protein GCK72_007105 [Caenorhabditis remanei]|uniref:Uncharacterized protein n=1 Tax=Caenorhabditis remanei TaxID=31234 RepID=A0A6A5HKD2_CAERE|nr:hypothetical protein GCK72_007105 [Caenorhabditis remanei]KAF1767146.1 hypothetical protein GCK72_007105 [Caenorhabditis remanei]